MQRYSECKLNIKFLIGGVYSIYVYAQEWTGGGGYIYQGHLFPVNIPQPQKQVSTSRHQGQALAHYQIPQACGAATGAAVEAKSKMIAHDRRILRFYKARKF